MTTALCKGGSVVSGGCRHCKALSKGTGYTAPQTVCTPRAPARQRRTRQLNQQRGQGPFKTPLGVSPPVRVACPRCGLQRRYPELPHYVGNDPENGFCM